MFRKHSQLLCRWADMRRSTADKYKSSVCFWWSCIYQANTQIESCYQSSSGRLNLLIRMFQCIGNRVLSANSKIHIKLIKLAYFIIFYLSFHGLFASIFNDSNIFIRVSSRLECGIWRKLYTNNERQIKNYSKYRHTEYK